MGINKWEVSEVYLNSIIKHEATNGTPYFAISCRIEGRMVYMQLFDDVRENNPFKRMLNALNLGKKFVGMKKNEMESALSDENSQFFNMLIEKKIPVDLTIKVTGFGNEKDSKFGYNVVDWKFSDSRRARKLVAKSLIPNKDVVHSTDKIDDLSEFGM